MNADQSEVRLFGFRGPRVLLVELIPHAIDLLVRQSAIPRLLRESRSAPFEMMFVLVDSLRFLTYIAHFLPSDGFVQRVSRSRLINSGAVSATINLRGVRTTSQISLNTYHVSLTRRIGEPVSIANLTFALGASVYSL